MALSTGGWYLNAGIGRGGVILSLGLFKVLFSNKPLTFIRQDKSYTAAEYINITKLDVRGEMSSW